jgi:hypothetical protein
MTTEFIKSHVGSEFTNDDTRIHLGVQFYKTSKFQHSNLWLPYCSSALTAVRFEFFTEVTMKKGVFWDVTPCVL